MANYLIKNKILYFWEVTKNVVMLLFGFAVIGYSPYLAIENWDKYQSQHWPSVTGRISNLYINYYFTIRGGHEGDLSFNYEYIVSSRHYISLNSEMRSRRGDLTQEKPRWESYKNGSEVQVLYDPKHPEHSILAHEKIYRLT